MGGSISVTLIEENGSMHKMQRWTNPVPRFMKDMKFFQKDKEHIQNYLNGWLPLKEDWEKNGPNGPFKHAGTKDFFPSIGMSPAEYGILVIDLEKNKIFSIQNYTDVDGIERLNRKVDEDDDWFEKNESYKEFENAGRILESHDSSDRLFTRSKIDISPFELFWFEKTADNMQTCMDMIVREYGLNEEEKKNWNENIEWLIQYEEKVKKETEEENALFWKQKEKIKKEVQRFPKTVILPGSSRIQKSKFIQEIAEETGMKMNLYGMKEKEEAFNMLKQPTTENTIHFFDELLFLDKGEETDTIREFIRKLPDTSVAVLSKRASYEEPILDAILK